MKKEPPHIGKNVIETLTLGMYEDARFIYREYVQNAADQIDVAVEQRILEKKSKGEINITIDNIERTIIVEDNATGIKSEDVWQFLGDVANSQKDRTKRKGFRGIGRLGGLGYCEKLIFETSYGGEDEKNIITLNAKQLKSIIEDKTIKMDAASVISVITTLDKSPEDKDKHYFKVQLEKVTSDELLDEESVRKYLSMVAPVPFRNDFPFAKKIHNYFNKNNVRIEEYDVHLKINDIKLHKPYKVDIYNKKSKSIAKILNVNFFKIKDEEDELIALGWYGISDLLNFQIYESNIERGLRLRKDNIGIGSETTLSKFYGQTRQNLNYIGEVHAVSSAFIPNARRDYFNDGRTTSFFEEQLKEFFSSLGSLTGDSSTLHNRKKDIITYKKEVQNYKANLENQKLTSREKEYYKEKLEKSKEQAIKSRKEIEKIRQKSLSNENLRIIHETIIGDIDIDIILEDDFEDIPSENYPIILSKLNENEKSLVKEIFKILVENLSLEKAEMLRKKIAKRYN